MLQRSQSKTQDLLLPQNTHPRSLTLQPKIKTEFIDTSKASPLKAVNELFQSHYGYPAKKEQNKSAVDLVHAQTVFLLAGTGFGKSQVPEAFYLAHNHQKYAPIILSINPLDFLGDDQVQTLWP
ncbi:hypothetical protein DFH28DRAFT_898233 [Melampsora americana]|nr:hypothetical protein DFH28DRAFT_898233 [Melampsora americana]